MCGINNGHYLIKVMMTGNYKGHAYKGKDSSIIDAGVLVGRDKEQTSRKSKVGDLERKFI